MVSMLTFGVLMVNVTIYIAYMDPMGHIITIHHISVQKLLQRPQALQHQQHPRTQIICLHHACDDSNPITA